MQQAKYANEKYFIEQNLHFQFPPTEKNLTNLANNVAC